MPTPVGHTLTALGAYGLGRPLVFAALGNPWLWLALVAASGPDLDFVPGLLLGNESLFHRGASHSIGGALIFGLAVLAAAFFLTRSFGTALRAALLGAGLFTLHLILDILGSDPGPPYGIPLFWPFSQAFFLSSWQPFPHLDRHPFDISVLARALPVAAAEILILGPFTILAVFLRRRFRDEEPPLP